MKRFGGPTRGPVRGYTNNTSLAISGSNNVQNARLNLKLISRNRGRKEEPLWGHHQVSHPNYVPARMGEIAFVVLPDSNDPTTATFHDNSFQSMGTFDPEIDSILYFSSMNSFGTSQGLGSTDDISKAQREWRRHISPIGVVVSSVEPNSNLTNLSNTVMVGKGKKTIANTGPLPIHAGVEVSADIPITADYTSYGLHKIDECEPDRFSLLTVPTQDTNSTIHEIREHLTDQYRNNGHRESSDRFIRGACGVGAAVMAYAALHGMGPTEVHDYANKDVKALATLPVIRLAMLSLDPEEDKILFSQLDLLSTKVNSKGAGGLHSSQYAPIFNLANAKTGFQSYIQKLSDYKSGSQGPFFGQNGPLKPIAALMEDDTKDLIEKVFGKLLEYGITDILRGVSEIVDISQRLKIGKAMTPASPGEDFDLMLGV